MKDLALNESIKINQIKVPETETNIYIIDNFIDNLAPIFNFAQKVAYYNPMFSDRSFYPGMRDHMPQPYLRLLEDFFCTQLMPLIAHKDDQVTFHKSLLSLVTCDPKDLITDQKIPHIDSCNSNDFAFVHYLSEKALGGTSIYKYKPKNIIEFKEEHKVLLPDMLNNVNKTLSEHSGYINGSTSIFEQVLKIEAKINRLIVYQGNLLHSANITSQLSYNRDPKIGRLSISSFASINK